MSAVNQVSDSVFTVEEFLSPAECESYIELSEGIGYADAPITTSRGPVHRPDIRNNTRVMLDDTDRASELWSRAAEYVQEWDDRWSPVGLNERLRFYRYDPGQQFDWHFDGCFERENGERSWMTFMIYLNADFEGGETDFEYAMVEPKQGMALFFVHAILHKGNPVKSGRKYVVRSDVMYRFDRS